MSNIGNVPFNWEEEPDNVLFGNMFSKGFDQNSMQPINLIENEVMYTSPFVASNKPKDGSFLKLDTPISVFENDFSYTIYVEKLQTGSEVLEAYNNRSVGKRDIVFFCEASSPNKSNLFKTFVLVKYGEEYRKLIYNLKEKKDKLQSKRQGSPIAILIENFDDELLDNYNILTKKYNIEIEIDSLRYVMENELTFTSNSSKTVADIYSWYNNGVSYVVDGVNGWLNDLKFSQEDYLPKKQETNATDSILSSAAKGIEYLIPDEIENFISDTFESALSRIKELAKENLPEPWVNFLKKVYNVVKEALKLFKKGIEFLAKIAVEEFLLGRALLMGFVNGLLSTIETILALIGWILKTNAYKKITGEYYRVLNSQLEFIEDFLDVIDEKANDFFNGITNLITDFSFDKVIDTLSVIGDKFKDLTRYDYAFFAGSFIFEVVLAVVLAFFTGGASLIVEASNLAEKQAVLFKMFIKEFVSTATMGLVDILKFFRILLTKFAEACSKGWKGFKRFLENLLSNKVDDVVKEDGKILDNITGNGLYGGKILSKSDIDDWAKLLNKKFGTILERVEKFESENILAQFDANTNTIKYKEDVTEYFMAHESFHAEEMHSIGFEEYTKNAPLKGIKEEEYTKENLIRLFKRERYVYNKLKANKKLYDLSGEEIWHIEAYFYEVKLRLIDRNIKIPK